MTRSPLLALSILAACLAPIGGCKDRSATTSTQQQTKGQPVFRQYEVRAVVEELPVDGKGTLRAHHEAIPNFDGGPHGMGMNVMTMPFWPPIIADPDTIVQGRVPETLEGLGDLNVGDAVSMRFEVQHASEGGAVTGYYATSITPLPEGTQPDFETRLPKTYTFQTRGEVSQLPDALGAPFKVHHEAVPEFPNPDGSMGMNTMTMQFWPAATTAGFTPHAERIPAELDLEGLEVGDKVMLTWEFQQDRATRSVVSYYAIRVEKLPADTALDFSPLQR